MFTQRFDSDKSPLVWGFIKDPNCLDLYSVCLGEEDIIILYMFI